ADRNRSHWSTSKTPSYTKSVSWQHHQTPEFKNTLGIQFNILAQLKPCRSIAGNFLQVIVGQD
ncbi:hypothetical protein M8T10_03950, partial [Enterobacter kobei]|uniref:hypothetical protein n=1 Tax=Enterobacter kobei TaxID=208224 RepID=UPI002075D5E4